MLIDVIASCEMLQQVVADRDRLDIAESFIARHAIKADYLNRRIAENADGLLERDARVIAWKTSHT
jgi:hypothetical protein